MQESKLFRVGEEVWEIIRVLLIAAAIILPIRYFIAQSFVVRGASMEPNFQDREYLVIDEISYYFRPPARGEAIVFHYPRDPRQFYIKRIIGLPGERVKIEDGQIVITNAAYPEGFTLQEQYLDPAEQQTYPNLDTALKDDEYLVLGDNRDASSDSRLWGPLPRGLIVGRTIFRAWPLARFGLTPNHSFEY